MDTRACGQRRGKRLRLVRRMHVPHTGSRSRIEGTVPQVNEFNKINRLEKVFHESSEPGTPGRRRARSISNTLGESRCAVRVSGSPNGAVWARACTHRRGKSRRLVRHSASQMHVPYTCSRCRIEGHVCHANEFNKINSLEKVFHERRAPSRSPAEGSPPSLTYCRVCPHRLPVRAATQDGAFCFSDETSTPATKRRRQRRNVDASDETSTPATKRRRQRRNVDAFATKVGDGCGRARGSPGNPASGRRPPLPRP